MKINKYYPKYYDLYMIEADTSLDNTDHVYSSIHQLGFFLLLMLLTNKRINQPMYTLK